MSEMHFHSPQARVVRCIRKCSKCKCRRRFIRLIYEYYEQRLYCGHCGNCWVSGQGRIYSNKQDRIYNQKWVARSWLPHETS